MKKASFVLIFALAAGCGGAIDSADGVHEGLCRFGTRCLLGQENQGTSLSGDIAYPGEFVLASSVFLNGKPVTNVRAVKGHLVGTNSQSEPISPDGWVGATMTAGNASTTTRYNLRVKAIMPASADPSDVWWRGIDPTGNLYLYDVEYQQGTSWVSFCKPDQYGEQHAIPLPLYYDNKGNQHVLDNPYVLASATKPTPTFAWACSAGVSAKAVKWGYFPWLQPDSTSWNQMLQVHWALTRAARADYCGDGVSHTYDNTLVRLWDNVTPSPIWPNPDDPSGGILAGNSGVLRAGLTATAADAPPTLYFEAGWSPLGAICLAKLRWDNLPNDLCPEGAPYADVDTSHVCDTQAEAERYADQNGPIARVFNKSAINPIPPTHPIGPIGPRPVSAASTLAK